MKIKNCCVATITKVYLREVIEVTWEFFRCIHRVLFKLEVLNQIIFLAHIYICINASCCITFLRHLLKLLFKKHPRATWHMCRMNIRLASSVERKRERGILDFKWLFNRPYNYLTIHLPTCPLALANITSLIKYQGQSVRVGEDIRETYDKIDITLL